MGPTGSEGKGCQVMSPIPGLCLSPALEAWNSVRWESRCEGFLLLSCGTIREPA